MPASSTNNQPGIPFIELASVDSTNNYAMQLVNKGLAESGTVIFAHEQTSGKGQRGKQWLADEGKNIMMSLVLNVSDLPVSRQFILSASIALAAHDFFDNYSNSDCTIKWPNDLYWRDRKAGGILIENIIRGQEWQWAIIGIGININQTAFDNNLINPVSLKQITGRDFNTIALAKELCGCIGSRLAQIGEGNHQALMEAYNAILYKREQTIRLKKDNVSFDCLLKRVNEFGQLVIEKGIEHTYNVGDVEWIFE